MACNSFYFVTFLQLYSFVIYTNLQFYNLQFYNLLLVNITIGKFTTINHPLSDGLALSIAIPLPLQGGVKITFCTCRFSSRRGSLLIHNRTAINHIKLITIPP